MGEIGRGMTQFGQVIAWLKQLRNLLTLLIAVIGLLSQALRIVPGLSGSWAPWLGLVLAVGSLAWLAWSAWRHWTRAKDVPPILEGKSLQLRGALPFEDGDHLMGRDHDIASLYTMVQSMDFRFGYLSGEAGAGKTSLLRAGLSARLRQEVPNWSLIYVPRPGSRPSLEIARMLRAKYPEVTAGQDGLRVCPETSYGITKFSQHESD
jgi:hypothetical protein